MIMHHRPSIVEPGDGPHCDLSVDKDNFSFLLAIMELPSNAKRKPVVSVSNITGGTLDEILGSFPSKTDDLAYLASGSGRASDFVRPEYCR